MENRSNLKGLKPGLPENEPGNTFPPLFQCHHRLQRLC